MKESCLSIIKGVIITVIASLVCVLAFAVVLKSFALSTSVVKPVNCIIKTLVIFLGCITTISREKFLLKGILIGFFATFLEYIIFGFISKDISFDKIFLFDLLFGGLIGGISALICLVVKKNN